MFPLQWLVLALVPLAVAQPAPPNCCATKTVGGVDYTFVREDSAAMSYSCLSSCVYERDDQPGTSFCFAQGDQQVVCGDSTQGCINCQLSPSERRMVDFGFGQVQRVVEGRCGLDGGQVLATAQEEEGVFQFSISISPKNLSCILNANEILPSICEIAVQATNNTTGMQVLWERVSCDNVSLERLASNLFEAMANLTHHLLPQMANISNLFLTAVSGQHFLQHFQDPAHVFEAVRNITTNLAIDENIVNIFQITQNVTETLLEMVNLTDIISDPGNGNNPLESIISQMFPAQNITTVIESIGIGAEFMVIEGIDLLQQGTGNFPDIGSAIENVQNIVESALEDFNNIFPNVFGQGKLLKI